MMKHLLQNQEFQLNEIIFQNRNKKYGAYALRNDSDKILTKAMFAGILLFGAFAATPFVVNAFQSETIVEHNIPNGSYHITEVEEIPDVKLPKTVPQQQNIKTVDTQIPIPTAHPKTESKPATMNERQNAADGFTETEGKIPEISYNPPAPNFQGPPSVGSEKTIPEVPDNSIKNAVDEEAVFKGGIDAFRNIVVKNFDTSDFEGTSGKLSTTITFVVEKDGTISGIQSDGKDVSFNKEAERTIKKIKTNWTPAKIKGQPVRSYFRFPISMMFE